MSSLVETFVIVLGGNAVFIWLIVAAKRGARRSRLAFRWVGAREIASIPDDELQRLASKCRVSGLVGTATIGLASLVVTVLVARIVASAGSVWPLVPTGDKVELVLMLALGGAALIEAPVAMWTVFASDGLVLDRALESRHQPG